MNRSWVRFPQAAQIRPPGFGWAFLYVCAVSRCCLWLVAPRVFWAPRGLPCWAWPLCVPVGGGPPARSPHASLRLGVVDLEARPGPATAHRHRGLAFRRPTHRRRWVADVWLCASTRCPAGPCHRPPAPRPGPAFCSSPVPSGPSGAHGHRSLAIRPLRCSPHGKRWGFCSIRSWLAEYLRRVAALMMQFPPIGAAASHGYRVWALQTRRPGYLKPLSPLRAQAVPQLKPSSVASRIVV